MTAATAALAAPELSSIVAGARVDWASLHVSAAEFIDACVRHDVRALVHARIGCHPDERGWPAEICDELAGFARTETAREMVRCAEIVRALDALAAAGIRPLVFKGTALAYTVYDAPVDRPRLDTDLLIDAADRDAARRILEGLGYTAPPYCDDLFSQFEMATIDAFGLRHVIDVHWKISTQTVFADVLSHGEMLHDAVPVQALGVAALAPGAVDALLLSCMHPAMHHQNAERILWIYDTHLLAARLTGDDFVDFARRARQKRVAAVCAHHLGLAHATFGTPVPDPVMSELSAQVDEPSAAYLASHRRWHQELGSNMRALPRVGDRLALLRSVLLPSPGYILAAYGLRDKPLAAWLLPALYVHRGARGAWRILAGKK